MKSKIVAGYVRMWPREVFALGPTKNGTEKTRLARGVEFLDGPGVYVLYRDDKPHYIGQALKLRHRLWTHATLADGRYFPFWNFFSAFAVTDSAHRNELEGVLIAAMPTANSAKPKLKREKMPKDVCNLLRQINNRTP